MFRLFDLDSRLLPLPPFFNFLGFKHFNLPRLLLRNIKSNLSLIQTEFKRIECLQARFPFLLVVNKMLNSINFIFSLQPEKNIKCTVNITRFDKVSPEWVRR